MSETPDTSRPVRPLPGPAPVRPIWDGNSEIDPATFVPPTLPEPQPAAARWTKNAAFGPSGTTTRMTGLDAARGFALLGMVAVHTLLAYNEVSLQPTIVWRLFAGHSAVLFGVLAGVAIALMTGGNTPHRGRRRRRDRVSLTVRALIILMLGLLIDQLAIPVDNILPYYGLMFLLAVPLVQLRIRYLLLGAGLSALVGPVLIFLTVAWGGFTTTINPNFTSLTTMPVDTLITLFVGGAYPVVTWMTYIFLGMAVGRLNLRWLVTQSRLMIVGGVTAGLGYLTSSFLLDYAGGFEQLYLYTDGYDEDAIQEILDYGPEGHLPTDTLWWLATAGPHTNTQLSILASAGLAVLAIGMFLVIARVLEDLLLPLIAAGSMTLTLYTAHMLFLWASGSFAVEHSTLVFFLQIVVILLFATGWYLGRGKGPLEEMVARTCRTLSCALIPDRDEERISTDRTDTTVTTAGPDGREEGK